MKKYLLVLGIISMFILSACAQQTTAPQTTQPAEITPVPSQPPIQAETPAPGQAGIVEEKVVAPASGVKEFDVTARQWEYTPSTITVSEGDTVILNIESVDVTHGFVIAEFGVSENLQPGKKVTVEFVADKAGEYTFFCNVPCGRGHGSMRGKLIVE